MADKCRLCRREAPLHKSHIIPRGVYNRIREANSTNENALVSVQPVNGTSLLTSRQVVQKLFCSECEKLFKIGEDYFYSLVDGTERGQGSLYQRVRDGEGGAVAAPRASEIVDIKNLSNFALGVFWRCNVSNVKEVKSYTGKMGACLEEEVRKFLLSEAQFPSRSLLLATVYGGALSYSFFSTPVASRISYDGQKLWAHRFDCLGLSFTFVRGGYEGFWSKLFSKKPSEPMFLTSEEFSRSEMVEHVVRSVHSTSPVGLLQKLSSPT